MEIIRNKSYEIPNNNPGIPFLGYATQIISEHTPEFDPDGSIKTRKAKQLGISVNELVSMWDEKAEASKKYGIQKHEEAVALIENDAHEQIHKIFGNTELFACAPECYVSDGIVSAYADAVFFLKNKDYKILHVVDFKFTDKPDPYKSYNSKLLHPFDYVDNSIIGKGLLQVALIQIVLKKQGYISSGHVVCQTPYGTHTASTDFEIISKTREAIKTLIDKKNI